MFEVISENFDSGYERASLVYEHDKVLSAVSVFSGCGGLDLGAKMAGVRVDFATDILNVAYETLRLNFNDAEIVKDKIENLKAFPSADLLIGGYPCQSFSMGGRRLPCTDDRSKLYLEYARCLDYIRPKYFIAENVAGLGSLANGKHLHEHLNTFKQIGIGYELSYQILDAASYGVPQHRKRLFIVGVRKDLGLKYSFPSPTHGVSDSLEPFASHGDAIKDLPLWPEGDFYERPGDIDGTFSWYYKSRNRKALWDKPSYTIVANWRHTTLHPASPTMHKVWSNLSDGYKQGWEFTNEYEHIVQDSSRQILSQPRRLSWKECARIQTFPDSFQFFGNTAQKITQIGNAVPPLLAYHVIENLISGKGLTKVK